ncbi:MAG: hypothetical protein ACAH95_12570 [Fimbriimonas sp.]
MDYVRKDTSKAFPCTFSFEGVTEFAILRSIEQDVFQKLRHSQSNLRGRVRDVRRIACVSYEEGRERYVLALNGWEMFKRGKEFFANPYSNQYNVLIECSRVNVNELCREGWEKLMNGEHLDVLEAFEELWPVPSWGVADFEEWLLAKGFLKWDEAQNRLATSAPRCSVRASLLG